MIATCIIDARAGVGSRQSQSWKIWQWGQTETLFEEKLTSKTSKCRLKILALNSMKMMLCYICLCDGKRAQGWTLQPCPYLQNSGPKRTSVSNGTRRYIYASNPDWISDGVLQTACPNHLVYWFYTWHKSVQFWTDNLCSTRCHGKGTYV